MLDVTWERLQVHVNGWGGHFVDPNDPSRLMMCEAEAMAALQWIHDRMWQDRVMASFVDVQNMTTRQAFVGGHLAMVEDGSWALRDILDGADFRIGVAPFPAGPKRRVTLATTDGFGIYAGTRHPEAAWELVKFLVSKTAGRALAQAHFLQPARASLLQDWIGFVRAEYPDATADLDLMAFADGHLNGYSVTAEAHANMATTRRLAYEIWDQVFTLGQWPVTQVETLCARIEGMRDAASG
jgi:multiple sugar transport system substrate-binding protein